MLKNLFKIYGWALLGQALNFLAMLMPILGKQPHQIAFLMFPLSLSAILVRMSILGFHGTYLVSNEKEQRVYTTSSVFCLTAISLLVVSAGFIMSEFSERFAPLILYSVPLLITQGIYLMAVTISIREKNTALYSKVRFGYGLLNIIFTTFFVFFFQIDSGLIWAASLTQLLAGLALLAFSENNIISPVITWIKDPKRPRILPHTIYSLRAALGSLVSDVSSQLEGFIVPLLGPYMNVWSVSIRIIGGFGTIAQQIVGPSIEAKLSEAFREQRMNDAKKVFFRGILLGLTIGMMAALTQLAAVWYTANGETPLYLYLVLGIYCLAQLSNSTILKVPLISKKYKSLIAWATTRCIIVGSLLFALRAESLIFAFAVASVCFSTWYILMSLPTTSPERKST